MPVFRNLIAGAAATLAPALVFATGASAQTALPNGVTISANTSTTILRTDPVNSLDLSAYGTQSTVVLAGYSLVSRAPMIQTLNGTSVSLSFTGNSGVFNSIMHLPPVGSEGSRNYLMAAGGSVGLNFSSAQNYFTMRWGSIDHTNNLQFYNGNQLVSSMTGTQLRSLLVLSTFATATVEFNFAQTGFTSVFARGNSTHYLDFDRVGFASNTPEVAPIPLGGVGGIVALLAIFALRRWQGGRLPQRLLAFASGARRQQVQRFA